MTPKKQERFDIKKLDYNKLLNIDEGRKNQLKLVEENPFIEITNNQSYILAKMRRTALLKGRTSIQGVEKTFATQIRKFRNFIGDTATELIGITGEAEDKQQQEIDRWEVIREEKRRAKQKADEERKAKHEQALDDFKTMWKDVIDSATFANLGELELVSEQIMGATGEFEEFQETFENFKKILSGEYLVAKVLALTLEEDTRLINIEKAELEKKQDEQAEKERLEKEATDKADKIKADKAIADAVEARRVRLLPDKERLIEVLEVLSIPTDKFENKEAQSIFKGFEKAFAKLKKTYIEMAENTL